jgi:hypothetical protein
MWDIVVTLTDVDGNTATTTVEDVWQVDGTCMDADGDGYVSGEADTGDAFCSTAYLAYFPDLADAGYGDCDDADATSSPGIPSDTCDDADNDCDTLINEDAKDADDLAGTGEVYTTAHNMGTFDADGSSADTITGSGNLHDDGDVDWWYWGVGTPSGPRPDLQEAALAINVTLPSSGDYLVTLWERQSGTTVSASGSGSVSLSAAGSEDFAETGYYLTISSTTWDPDACSAGYAITVTEN